MKRGNLIDAWRKAEGDLGIKVNAKFQVELWNGPKDFLFIEYFGGPKGAIATLIPDTKDFEELREFGFHCSAPGNGYVTYDRTLFADTLNAWGFFGNANGAYSCCRSLRHLMIA